MANKDDLRQQAQVMFVEMGMTGKAIAETLDVRENTVSTWRKDDEWDKLRKSVTASPERIKNYLFKEYESLAAGNAPKLNSDAISKISKALEFIESFSNESRLTVMLNMLDRYAVNVGMSADWLQAYRNMKPDFVSSCLRADSTIKPVKRRDTLNM